MSKGSVGKTDKFSGWKALKDVTNNAINKGQLGLFGILFVLAIIFYRLPPEGLQEVILEILTILKKLSGIAYVLLLGTITGWAVHARKMRRYYSSEIKRIAEEKARLQNLLGEGEEFTSSNQ